MIEWAYQDEDGTVVPVTSEGAARRSNARHGFPVLSRTIGRWVVDGDQSDADIAADQIAALLVGQQITMSDGQPMTVTASRRGGPWLILRDDETEMRVRVDVVFAAGGGIGRLHDEDPPATGQPTSTPTGSTS